MPTRTLSVLLAAGLATAIAAQSSGNPQASLLHSQAPDPAVASGGGHAARPGPTPVQPDTERFDALRARLAAATPQDPDYSMRGLFQQDHGDFMLRRERFDPMLELSHLGLNNASIQHEPGRFNLDDWNGDLEVPLMVSTDAYIELGMFIGTRDYNTKRMPGFPDTNLNMAGIHAGFGLFLDPQVLLEGKVSPGTWSDWDGTLHHQDYDYPAELLVTVQSTQDLFWKIGVRYNEVFADANVLPYLGLSWQYEEYRLDVLAPEYLEFSYWPIGEGGRQSFGILFGAEIQGAEYRVRSSLATGKQEGNTRVQEVLVYGGLVSRFSDHLSLRSRLGIAAAGDYKLDDGDPSTPRVTGTLKTDFFFEMLMGIEF